MRKKLKQKYLKLNALLREPIKKEDYRPLLQASNLFLKLFFVLFLASCSTTPKNFSSLNSGEWEARALIKDKVTSKRYIVNIDFVAERPSNLRMEVTSTIGQHLASFAMNSSKVTYLVPKNKSYYKGGSTAESMRAVLGHPFNPHLITNVLFDEPVASKDWSCTNDEKGNVVDCKSQADEVEIDWAERSGQNRNVFIKQSKFEIQLQFHKYEKIEKSDPKIFEIAKPNGFKQI